jgi:hypothetical protein
MIGTLIHIVDLIMTLGATVSGLYLLIFTIASLRRSKLRFPEGEELSRFLVLIPEDSVFTEQEYPAELYRVESYTDLVAAVQGADISNFDMFVILGETTHVSPQLLKYISDARYGNARAIQLCHITEGHLSFRKHYKAVYEGIAVTIESLGHNRFEWPSSLRRTDIALEASWLQSNLFSEKSNIENRLLRQGVFIHYLPYACVYSNEPRIRKRDPFALKRIFTALPGVLAEGNLYYADKLIRAVFPSWHIQVRCITLWMLVCMFIRWSLGLKWFIILTIYMILLAIAVPDYLVVDEKKKKSKKSKKREKKEALA